MSLHVRTSVQLYGIPGAIPPTKEITHFFPVPSSLDYLSGIQYVVDTHVDISKYRPLEESRSSTVYILRCLTFTVEKSGLLVWWVSLSPLVLYSLFNTYDVVHRLFSV